MEQFGIRPGHSTKVAVSRLIDHQISQLDNNVTSIILSFKSIHYPKSKYSSI